MGLKRIEEQGAFVLVQEMKDKQVGLLEESPGLEGARGHLVMVRQTMTGLQLIDLVEGNVWSGVSRGSAPGTWKVRALAADTEIKIKVTA